MKFFINGILDVCFVFCVLLVIGIVKKCVCVFEKLCGKYEIN